MFPKAIRLRTLIIMSSLDWFEPGGRENFARITRSVRTARLNVYSAYPLTTVLPIRRFFDDSPNRFKMNYLSRFTRIETSSADFASIFKAPSVIAFRMSSLKYFAYTSLPSTCESRSSTTLRNQPRRTTHPVSTRRGFQIPSSHTCSATYLWNTLDTHNTSVVRELIHADHLWNEQLS